MSDLLKRILAEKTDEQLKAECEWQAERYRMLSQGLSEAEINAAWDDVMRKLHPDQTSEAWQ